MNPHTIATQVRILGRIGCSVGTVNTVLTCTAKPRTAQMKRTMRSFRVRTIIAATIRPGRGSWLSEEVALAKGGRGELGWDTEVLVVKVSGGRGGLGEPSGTGVRVMELALLPEAWRHREEEEGPS